MNNMVTRIELIDEIRKQIPERLWDRNKTSVRYMKHKELTSLLDIIQKLKDTTQYKKLNKPVDLQ